MWIPFGKLGVTEKTVMLVRYFHQDMRASNHMDRLVPEEIYVENGVRHGCCLVPVLFNLYTCLAMVRWVAGADSAEGVGIAVRYKYDKKLFRRYTRNANQRRITMCLFADDVPFLGADTATQEYQ